jgi:hypothetical protein
MPDFWLGFVIGAAAGATAMAIATALLLGNMIDRGTGG